MRRCRSRMSREENKFPNNFHCFDDVINNHERKRERENQKGKSSFKLIRRDIIKSDGSGSGSGRRKRRRRN